MGAIMIAIWTYKHDWNVKSFASFSTNYIDVMNGTVKSLEISPHWHYFTNFYCFTVDPALIRDH